MYTRNLFFLFAIILLIASGCKKDNNNDSQPDDFTPIPPATTLNTTITTYVAPNNNNNANVSIGFYNGEYSHGGYSKEEAFDQFNTYIAAGFQSGSKYFSGFRFIPVSSSSRNYVDIAGQEQLVIRNISTGNGSGYFPLPKGGKIIYPNNGFGAGIGSDAISVSLVITDPAEPTFAISNPTVSVDLDGQRWYLRSYGAFLIYFEVPLMAGKFAELEYPIPVSQQANAPDSIEAYHMEHSAQWVKRGVAQKQGNVYKYTLPADGAWSFGVRQKGIYKTFQVRTATGIPVINAIVRIKSGATEIGEARTDADGNAICFVPVGESFTISIPPSWAFPDNPSSFTTTVGPFNFTSNTPQLISYPTATTLLRIIKGKANNCDGTPIKKGTVTVVRHFDGFEYCHIPVIDGQYSGAVVKDQYIDPHVCVVKLKSNTASQAGKDTAIAWNAGVEKNIDLNICPTPTNLYVDYTVDGVSYSIKGDASSPRITYDHGTTSGMISAADGSKIFQFLFPASFSWPGTHPTGFSWVWINTGFVPDCLGSLTFTRYDLVPGGYAEGSFDMFYYESSGVKHEIKGKFRVYRAS